MSEVGDGALLIELASGSLFRLNLSALFVWRGILRGEELPSLARALADEFGLSRDIAEADVAAAINLAPSPSYTTRRTDFEYKRTPAGYELWFRGAPALHVDVTGSTVTALGAELVRARSLELLRAIAPKLVALRGGVVLHASSISVRGRVIAFTGESGAGKTTTARALVKAGATLIGEDMMVLLANEEAEVAISGEESMKAWASAFAQDLAERGKVDSSPLDSVFDGERAPLEDVALISADRRSEVESARRLGPVDAALALFENAFHGRDEPREWTRQLSASCRAATMARVFRASMPRGLAALDQAARRIMAAGTVATAP